MDAAAGPASLAKSDFEALVRQELRKKEVVSAVTGGTATALSNLLKRREILFEVQRAFVEDPAKRKVACCTRRAGKTFAMTQLCLEAICSQGWDNPNKAQPIVQIIAPTKKYGGDMYWEPLKAVARQVGLDGVWNDHELRAEFPNGVLLRVGGANDRAALEDYRGGAYTLVVLDEAASYGSKMESLVMSSISMAMKDYQGTIAMVGSPGEVHVGLFYEICHGMHEEWSHYAWSFMTNTSIPAQERTLEYIERFEGPLDSPRVRRECFGEWVADGGSLVYKFNPEKNLFDGVLPEGHAWRYILGIDLGYNDPTAFAVVAHSKTNPNMYLVHAESRQHMLPSDIAQRISELRQRYDFKRIVCDTGGSMAKNSMIEWNRRYGFGMIAASKTDKNTYIEHMNSDFHQGRLKVYKGATVIKEWNQLLWNDNPNSVRHDGKPTEHPGFPNHECDATLYAYRESMHFRGKTPDPIPEPNSQEHWNKFETDARLKVLKRAKLQRNSYNNLWK